MLLTIQQEGFTIKVNKNFRFRKKLEIEEKTDFILFCTANLEYTNKLTIIVH